MKRACYLFILSLLAGPCFSQAEIQKNSSYLFPEFADGVVLMKSGFRNEVRLNYNLLSEEMIFIENGTKLAMGMLEMVDTVYVSNRKFLPMENKFVELIFDSKYALFSQYRCKLKDPGKPAGFGGNSQTSATKTITPNSKGGKVYGLEIPEGYESISYTEYYLKKDGKLTKFISIRQLSKLFHNKQDIFKEYVSKHHVKYDNQASIVELIRFMAAN